MSRIGKQPIKIPEGIQVAIAKGKVLVTGPKGTLNFKPRREVKVKKEDNQLVVERVGNSKLARSLHGLTRALVANMVIGVTEGFKKALELVGVGFRAALEGESLVLKLGFSHPVKITPPSGIKFEVAKNKIVVSGIDKQAVGEIAAQIRKIRPPDPYKGKGIKYEGEKIRKKPGKAAKAVGLGGGA